MIRSALLVLVLTASAHADGGEDLEPGASTATSSPNRINLRLGSATSDSTGRPVICLDVRIVKGLGVEGCGTGQGVIHDQTGTELAHFRATYSILERTTKTGTGRIRGGLGFAELQVGVDRAGFNFNTPDVERGSVAGPEASIQGQWLVPLGAGVEAVASATIGAAAFANADKLVTPQSNLQPFASFEIGLGW